MFRHSTPLIWQRLSVGCLHTNALVRSVRERQAENVPRQNKGFNPRTNKTPQRYHGARKEALPQGYSQEDYQGAFKSQYQEKCRRNGMVWTKMSHCYDVHRSCLLTDLPQLRLVYGNVCDQITT